MQNWQSEVFGSSITPQKTTHVEEVKFSTVYVVMDQVNYLVVADAKTGVSGKLMTSPMLLSAYRMFVGKPSSIDVPSSWVSWYG